MLRSTLALALTLTLSTQAAIAGGFAQAPETTDRAAFRQAPVRISVAARARLKRILAARRAKNLAAFRAYAKAGVYPHNYASPGALNVWIDRDGHKCAAATMIYVSGERDLVEQIGRDQNGLRLGSLRNGPVLDWILTSGLTQGEVALIQRPFVGRPEGPTPKPGVDWKVAADKRLRRKYDAIDVQLVRADSLDVAIDVLVARPDLVASLLVGT